MIAALIGIVSLAALLQFVYYCRSALASARRVELSDHVLAVAGLKTAAPVAGDFRRFLALVELCPERQADASMIRAVSLYYDFVGAVERGCGQLAPAIRSWCQQEQLNCSRFAAVVLDRRISSSRDLFVEHAFNRL